MSILDYGGYYVIVAILGAAWILHHPRSGSDSDD